MFYYNHHSTYLLIFLPVYAGAVLYLTSGMATDEILSTLQASVIPIMLLSRVRN